MSPKAVFALLLASLCCLAHAQDALIASEQVSAADVVEWPSMEQVMHAYVSAGVVPRTTYIRIRWDADGRVLEARPDPSTHAPALDNAIRKWAKKLRLKPGSAGSGWLPLVIGNSR